MVDTLGAVPNHYNTCIVLICPQRCEQQTVSIVCPANALISAIGWAGHRVSSLGTTLRVSTMCLPDDIACDQISQAFPCHISYWKRGNTGGGNGLGTRLYTWWLCSRGRHVACRTDTGLKQQPLPLEHSRQERRVYGIFAQQGTWWPLIRPSICIYHSTMVAV